MGVTFDYLITQYEYTYKSKVQKNGHYEIIFSNDYKDFVEWLQRAGLYEEYIQERDKDIPVHEGQYTIDDYLGG